MTGTIPLPADRLEGVSSWGGNLRVASYVYRPSDIEGIRDVFDLAHAHGVSIGLRGSGCSYGDAALNREEIALDLSRMNRILDWNAQTGVLRLEPGVTIQQIWQHGIGDGWWPHVVPGTMFPTVGGALAANIHGKNHLRAGTIGEHVQAFDLLLPDGETRTCTPAENAELFHAAIGGFGLLGVFTSITLTLRKVHSGLLRVTPTAAADWDEMFRVFRTRTETADYVVGWTDCFASGSRAGRGLIHAAQYLPPGEDPQPAQTLRAEYQNLSDTVLGVPKSVLHRFLGPVFTPVGMRAANNAQYLLGSRKSGTPHYETHAGFAFMLDYVPGWKRAYGPGGLMQYQTFIPDAQAEAVFRDQLDRCRQADLVPCLSVFKRHRADNFLLSYAVDGWSLALDFPHTRKNHDRLLRLFADMDSAVIAAGGRFYFAKDSALSPERLLPYFADPRVQRFLQLKRELDPERLLQTDLFRRVFGKAKA